jgi:2'-5' RNA ligase
VTRGGEARRRLFVAADLPPDALAAVRAWQQAELGARDCLRSTRSLHVTLCFLGDTAERRVDELVSALSSVAVPELPAEFGEPLFLPPRGRASVVAVRIGDPSGAIVRLQAEMSASLVEKGFLQPEKRAYLPHLTVARFRRPGHPFSLHNVNFPGFCLPSVILYSSNLEKGGAVHTPLATFPAT